jgi:hypothetical protein
MENNCTIVRMMSDGETVNRLALTEKQLDLLHWLSCNEWLYDGVNYELEDVDMEIITI